jgi:ADP-ribose pyrophosphatase YjhB (NUDIX family)
MRSPYRGWVTGVSSHLAVGAIVRRASDILLVREEGDEPVWALPGGPVSAGESVDAALRRRVSEESGLFRSNAGRLLWLARYTVGGEPFETLVFEVLEGTPYTAKSMNRGTLLPSAAWVPLDEAIERLAGMWFPPIRDPAVAYLTERAPAATLWTWTRLDSKPETVPRLAPVS